jgi:hypothetical protein
MIQKANVSHGKPKMDKMVRRRELACVRRLKPLYRERSVRGTDLLLMERKKKSDEKAKKKRR